MNTSAARILLAVLSACLLSTLFSHTGFSQTADPADQATPKIVTLAPHLAELVFSAGAGDQLIGVSAYSDFPEAVLALPQVGDAFLVDQERLALLAPDLILAWESGTPERTVAELRKQGFRVVVVRTRSLADVAVALEAIGRLAGTETIAATTAAQFTASIGRLREKHANGESIRVFYQISARPIYTVSGSHYISELIEICGGSNIFADLGELAPLVSEEAVLARNPELMLAGGGEVDAVFEPWLRWDSMAAVRWRNLSIVEADLIGRATPRLAEAGSAVCAALDAGRQRRAAAEA